MRLCRSERKNIMEKVQWKGGTLLAPVPAVLVSYGTVEKPAALTIAWTGIISSDPPKTYISVRPSRYSYDIIKESGEFVINMMPSTFVRQVDYCGIKSTRTEDKLAKMKLIPTKSNIVKAPQIEQCPISLECKVTDILPQGSHDMFIAEIVSVNINEELIDAKGRLMIEKAGLMAYAHGTYFALGKKVGSFGFSVKPKRAKNPHHKKKK